MTIDEVLEAVLGCGEYDIKNFFDGMDYDTFNEGLKRSEDEGVVAADSIWYNAIEYALWECFGEDAEKFEIDANFMAANIGADEDDVRNITNFDVKNENFYNMTGWEVTY